MFFFFFFFEQSAIDIIKQFLQDDETLIAGEIKCDYAYDYLLPKGCVKLGFPPKTAIEFKKELVPGIYSILFSDARNAVEQEVCDEFIVIYEEKPWYHDSYIIPSDIEKHFKFLPYEELMKMADNCDINLKPKDWKDERTLWINKLHNEILYGQNTLFLGAGLSGSLGVPGWDSLLESLFNSLKPEDSDFLQYESILKDSDKSYLVIARYIADFAKKKNKNLVSEIRSLIYKDVKQNSAYLDSIMKLIISQRIGEIITYNYDTLLEQRMEKEKIRTASVDSKSRRVKNALPIMHVHGIIAPDDSPSDSNVVLSEDAYHDLYRDSFHWANVAQLYALTHTQCIFAGLSMKDPSLRRLLDIAYSQGTKDVCHYAFLIRNDYQCHQETEALFSQMGVRIIWCEDWDDVPAQIMRVVE